MRWWAVRITSYYSHINGLEYLLVHKPGIWEEIKSVVSYVRTESLLVRWTKKKGRTQLGYPPVDLERVFKKRFTELEWRRSRAPHWEVADPRLVGKTMELTPTDQRTRIEAQRIKPILSFNQEDFVKERVAVEVRFNSRLAVAYDLFVKHLAFFVGDMIDVGIEIVPMKTLQEEMSSGVPYYEGELYNLIREGRGVPAVPLVLIGVAP